MNFRRDFDNTAYGTHSEISHPRFYGLIAAFSEITKNSEHEKTLKTRHF